MNKDLIMQKSGLIIGHFEPLHLGHIRSILHASSLVDVLHIVITRHPNPNPKFPVTLQDKARWLQMACRDLPFIKIHICDDFSFPVHDSIENITINIDSYNAKLDYIKNTLQIVDEATLLVTEGHPLSKEAVTSALNIEVETTPLHREFDSIAIHYNPIANWDIIHPEARSSYTRTVAIVGGESSGKTILAHKIANYYGTDLALEMGRLYVDSHLGGTEEGLQYSDYAAIALDHAQAVREAMNQAKSPVTIVDTDFVTTQAFCEEYEGRTHPFVAACIDEFRFDHTLFLANNTPWIDDGMRSLGSPEARDRFEDKLTEIFERHNITTHHINSPDYFQRYQEAIVYIDQHIFAE
ncbi:multifunctional transcriptional regulator/nicotinamide-nucleotide adenylyltransferase/ribosylnicotinamide kinase NadR [Psychrobacter lutiphocae]|uniref:multifunctional transcriptional regulator/nicotinamide-nucleotide adenylyltransferase/ribosylnicotinamide kinase NadR n=1 Tax=Psychrobacter lutiphocae TaxID=540500 RepID=UPI001D10906D|nr:multifunctional transcriptional regulator/nicotinamide-nucleotide adenylyltransferase/ribosylnicotinamide kinase NadR [Psychrobacter lutiphocae]